MSRWTVVIPEKTNRMVRTHLAMRGAKKGDLSKFVDHAVRQTLFRETVDSIKERNAEKQTDLIESAITEAIDWARETRS
ncbi:MAG: ribbon-helix-helix domain-containing protein [Verrucomicrobiota bacterium]